MFVIKPIKEIELHKAVCKEIGCEYVPGTISFAAAELMPDNETVDYYIGICQFIPGEDCRICSLFPGKGSEDDEAVMILLRTVMSFLERSGGKNLKVSKDAAPLPLLKASGLTETSECFEIDLTEFYKSPCRYKKEHDNG